MGMKKQVMVIAIMAMVSTICFLKKATIFDKKESTSGTSIFSTTRLLFMVTSLSLIVVASKNYIKTIK